MRKINLRKIGIPLGIMLILLSGGCTKDDPDPQETPVAIAADNIWIDADIATGEIQWYKVMADASITTLYVEWAEADFHGPSKSYTADIKVSAYMLDGESPYFEEKNNGYGEKIRSLDLENEHEVLLKVELYDEARPGSYAIRSTGVSNPGEVSYIPLSIGDVWTKDTIMDGELIGYLVDCGDVEKVSIIWAEIDSPEEGYTAEVMGSVFYLDGETPYKDLVKGKDILNKNNSHSNDPKAVQVDTDEKSIKIHMAVNTSPGTFAIKVIPFQ